MEKPIKLALCWHMHQPYYRDELHGEYHLPWVYLHAIKDYSDMAWHLEQHPDMRMVVNFAPVLLEQLLDYARQLKDFLDDGRPMNDPLLNLLAGVTSVPADNRERQRIINECQRCNADTMIAPWPAYRLLTEIPRCMTDPGGSKTPAPAALSYLSDDYFHDLLVWYHIAWLGQSLKRKKKVAQLINKGSGYTIEDRHLLLRVMSKCIDGIIPRYRALAEQGQIELSMSPWGHPIIPLLHDFDNAACALPDAPRPEADYYPGGRERSRWHIEHGIELFERCFGHRPQGVWLSEGSLSAESLELLDEFGMKWTASGENVWRNSARLSKLDEQHVSSKRGLFHVYHHSACGCRIFFRDDGLSDLIGFEYRDWDAGDAVANLVTHIKNIGKFLAAEKEDCVISIIMDGENAWEYYPDNGAHFIEHLYRAIVHDREIEPITFAEAVQQPVMELPDICPGSWVYGSFSTWIGDVDKNRAWDLLVEAKHEYDRVMGENRLDENKRLQITRQLGICEGSDWFWWFGDYNPSESVQDFDGLFRSQLRKLYQLMDVAPPPALELPISHGSMVAHGDSGAMQRNT